MWKNSCILYKYTFRQDVLCINGQFQRIKYSFFQTICIVGKNVFVFLFEILVRLRYCRVFIKMYLSNEFRDFYCNSNCTLSIYKCKFSFCKLKIWIRFCSFQMVQLSKLRILTIHQYTIYDMCNENQWSSSGKKFFIH